MADDRVRGALLAGLTVAAMVLGGWWWQTSAPALGPVGASPSPSTGAFLEPGVRLVDPQTGEVFDAKAGAVVHEEPDATEERMDTVWEDQSHLDARDDPLVRQSNPSAGQRHRLMVSCSGSGTVTVHLSGADQDASPTTTCDAVLVHSFTTTGEGPLLVRFSVADGEVDLNARLAVVF